MRFNIFNSLTLVTSICLLSACNSSEEINDSIDEVPAPYHATISYVNVTGTTSTFFTKSSVYFDDVFSDRHRVVELPSLSASEAITHDWIEGYSATEFAVQESMTGAARASIQESLEHRGDYWHVALGNSEFPLLKVFEKSISSSNDGYTVRVLTNSDAELYADSGSANLSSIVSEQLTEPFLIQNCSGFFVGEIEVDLCQFGDIGKPYLVVVDAFEKTYVVLDESNS